MFKMYSSASRWIFEHALVTFYGNCNLIIIECVVYLQKKEHF